MDERESDLREDLSADRQPAQGPVGTVLGWSLGPFGAAVGGVVDANRVAFKLSVGAGADRSRSGDHDRGTTIEIDDGERTDEAGPAGEDPDSDH